MPIRQRNPMNSHDWDDLSPFSRHAGYNKIPAFATPTPNGLDHQDLNRLLQMLLRLDASDGEFNGTIDINSQDRVIHVRIWHDSEFHRLEVLES